MDRRTGREPLLADLSAVVSGGSPYLRVALRYDAHGVRMYTARRTRSPSDANSGAGRRSS
ncbi:hypothetical protein [Streptomyces microflavus]|uniref:hypothetical protein n=1 Tax=Streptomyces microflavus TaxID=1919 RepID=UPI0036508174